MKTKFLYFLIIFSLSCYVCSASVYDHKTNAKTLSSELPKLNNIECKFKQEKILKNVQKPLISNGNFKFDKKQGIFFETTYPIKSTTSYTGKDYQQINDIILAISNKKYSKLDKEFDFYYQNQPSEWILGLKPKEKTTIDKYITSITINGNNSMIKKIVISMKDGSKTTQWFSIN